MRLTPLEAMSKSLRSVITAAPGYDLIGGDFAAIEARVIAWLAGQQDVLDILADPTRDLYVEDARNVGSSDRQFGKTQRLGLNYQMGPKRFVGEAAKNGITLTLKESARTVRAWRKRNDRIVSWWKELADAMRSAIRMPGSVHPAGTFIQVGCTETCLMIRLPSDRVLRFWRPSLRRVTKEIEFVTEEGELETFEITNDEINFFVPSDNATDMWQTSTYEGEAAENVTQAVARDLMAEALMRLDPTYPVVVHVHDSVASEVPEGFGSTEEFNSIMSTVPGWAPGLPIRCDVYRDKRFRG